MVLLKYEVGRPGLEPVIFHNTDPRRCSKQLNYAFSQSEHLSTSKNRFTLLIRRKLYAIPAELTPHECRFAMSKSCTLKKSTIMFYTS